VSNAPNVDLAGIEGPKRAEQCRFGALGGHV
jgi:hypothetical protein